MGISDLIDVFVNLSLIGGKKTGTRRPKIYILFYILLVPSLFWFIIELRSILTLQSPFVFLGLFIVLGLILTALTIIVIYKVGLIEELTKKDFFLILIPVTLLTVCLANYANRIFEVFS
jgi:hypothetical protein